PAYPSFLSWLVTGCFRNWPGLVGAFVANSLVAPLLVSVPLSLVKALYATLTGLDGGFLGALIAVQRGFVGWLLLSLPLVALDSLLLGLLFTIGRIIADGWLLRIRGAREPSRRERELILPILVDCAARLELGAHPKLLIDDAREP